MSTDVQEQMHIYREMQRLGALQPSDGPMVLVAEIDRLTAELAAMREADTLRAVQTQLKPWQERNFPDRPVWMPVMGLAEEAGEACHAALKREQGIRCNEDHTGNLHDALADVIVYACDVANAEGVDLAELLAATWAKVQQRDWVAHREAAQAAERGE